VSDLLIAALLGLLEGLTEFIPVSSTGHLLLAGHFLGFQSAGKTFEVVIQLGAVLALMVVYAARLWQVFSTAHKDPAALRFVVSVALAFVPAAVIGVLAHDFIKSVLFETPRLIAAMLILGGVVLQGAGDWVLPMSGDGARRIAVGGHDCRRAVSGRR
jgi:undecaprenyl-diphosphatase